MSALPGVASHVQIKASGLISALAGPLGFQTGTPACRTQPASTEMQLWQVKSERFEVAQVQLQV